MAELSEVKKRVPKKIGEVMHRTYDPIILADAIIPLAQFQLDKPTEKELDYLTTRWSASQEEAIRDSVIEFVRRRNAALQSKPVDPRIAKVVVILDEPWITPEDRAVKILAVIDRV
jgi:hypothetical protein